MPRNCDCAAGACGPQPITEVDGITRREFIQIAGIGAVTAGALIMSAADVTAMLPSVKQNELEVWKKSLHQPATPRVYHSDIHKDARMHLGGIGTGNFEIGSDGQFTTWQLFNTLRDGFVPLVFAVKAGNTAKVLQTEGGPGFPKVKHIRMKGEYPFAELTFEDNDLPVQLSMQAYSPFAPLDTELSSIPAAVFVLKVKNPTNTRQMVSLAAMMQNPVGYDAMGVPISFNSVGFNEVPAHWQNDHPNFGGNVNESSKKAGCASVVMTAVKASEPTITNPMTIFTNLNIGALNAAPLDRPKSLNIQAIDVLNKQTSETKPVIWLEEPAATTHESVLRTVRDAVMGGSTLIISGRQLPLIDYYAKVTGGKPLNLASLKPDVVFEDFDNGYDKWKVEGTAFGTAPAKGTLSGQQQVTGFLGQGFVNSFNGGDDTTGKLTSQDFKIDHKFIRFLIGGGRRDTVAIRLFIGGKMVRTKSGNDDEKLLPAQWDVTEFAGKSAHIEIVDDAKDGWGHINVDQIEFSDYPGSVEVLKILEELLPFVLKGVTPDPTGNGDTKFEGMIVRDTVGSITTKSGTKAFIDTVGNGGKVIVVANNLLAPQNQELTGARQAAYETIGELTQNSYTRSNGIMPTAPGYGELCLATTGPNQTSLTAFADWKEAWTRFSATGKFDDINGAKPSPASPQGKTHNAAVASTVEVGPGKTVEIPFILSWRYPNKYNHSGQWIGCHYAEKWKTASAVVDHVAANLKDIHSKTERFRTAFYDSTLPYWMLDSFTSQMAILRHIGIVFRIANGDVYGWEGSNGCCDPTCTHVWGYEQTLARTFPDLERDMRRIDLKHQQGPDGGINNRTAVPSPPRPSGEHPFIDGHASSVLKAYREALNHPDDSWLKENWPQIKKAVDYMLGRDIGAKKNYPEGILEDDQWNTYDEALHGVTTFIGTYYLAALRAGEEMARKVGDQTTGNHYRTVFERGRDTLHKRCWNGEYYHQDLPGYKTMFGEIGPGCLSDQVIGQWWAHQLGLGYVLPKENVQIALKNVFKYNWLPDHTNWKHNWRKFAGGKDKGLLICAWPTGGRPNQPVLYCDEVWTGVEYQVAAHMIYEGMIDEAFAIVKGLRDRYDGVPRAPMPRNPWNEIECGGHYARAMSSWSVLLALSGYEYDGTTGYLRFTPRYTPDKFKSFFTGPESWGHLIQTRTAKTQKNEIAVLDGKFACSHLHLQTHITPKSVKVTAGGKPVMVHITPSLEGVMIKLETPVTIGRGENLVVSCS